MNKFETPQEFELSKKVGKDVFSYSELMEIVQGGPEIGFLNKNGKLISNLKFGGPFIYDNEFLYVPVYVKRFLKSGFRLARINIETLIIEQTEFINDIILLDRIKDGKIFFFEDIDKTKSRDYLW